MRRRLLQLLPQSLLGRLTLVMVAGLLVAQLAASTIWASQSRAKARVEAQLAPQYMAHSASGAIRFFRSLPANYRLLLIQQLREMGGTRFFVNLNRAYVPVARIAEHPLARSVIDTVGATLKNDLPHSPDFWWCAGSRDIHENPAEVKLDALLGRLVRSARLPGQEVGYQDSGVSVRPERHHRLPA